MSAFDGVICFGDSDWWYHNRGHYDMQMMRQMARHVPVLYVNSIGLRMPSIREGGMFLRRLRRKIGSLGRGLVAVDRHFSVFSPLVVPGRRGLVLSRPLLCLQIRWAVRRLGIHRPLVWLVCPSAAVIAEALRPAGLVYQRTDAYETYPGADAAAIRRLDLRMKAKADLTLFCSSGVLRREKSQCRRALFADHGVDFDRFDAAGRAAGEEHEPQDMRHLRRPRVGFVGGIDSHTFDPPLFCHVVDCLPHVQFVLVGACSLPPGWCRAANVAMLGRRPYEQVAAYMAACDVLIMPWNRSEWIRSCNPVKLKEYLAVGRPIVSTPFDELCRYENLVLTATDGDSFVRRVREALEGRPAAPSLRQRLCRETWQAKGQLVLDELAQAGLYPARKTVRPAVATSAQPPAVVQAPAVAAGMDPTLAAPAGSSSPAVYVPHSRSTATAMDAARGPAHRT